MPDNKKQSPTLLSPQIGVGAVIFNNNAVLLVKRKNPPCENEWAIPGGKVKLGETLKQAAEREILEETGIQIRALHSIYTFELIERDENNNIKWHYVIVDLLAEYIAGQIRANDDAIDARWVTHKEFSELNINSTTKKLLEEKFNDRFMDKQNT